MFVADILTSYQEKSNKNIANIVALFEFTAFGLGASSIPALMNLNFEGIIVK